MIEADFRAGSARISLKNKLARYVSRSGSITASPRGPPWRFSRLERSNAADN